MTVFLVGAGPGDPGLITVRGLDLIKKADVILYDRLVNESLLESAPGACEMVFVGKEPGCHAKTQDEINSLIAHHGARHRCVVRLKGGDPFVFGRGGEEAEICVKNSIPFEVVPGITSAVAGPAYAGIPVTHRAHNTSVTIMTGHRWDSSRVRDTYPGLSGTLVILMGAAAFPMISEDLIEMGYSPDTPAAAIHRATTADQRTIRGTLATLATQTIPSPSVIIVGTVSGLSEAYGWYEKKRAALCGKKVLFMRTPEQFGQSRKLIEALGASALNGGSYSLRPLEWDTRAFEVADIAVITSANTVPLVKETLKNFPDKTYVAIGPGTRRALSSEHIRCVMPDEYTSEGLGMLLRSMALPGQKIVGIRSSKASDVLASMLGDMDYTELCAYDIGYESVDEQAVGEADIIFFTSSEMVRAICGIVRGDQVKISIGPQTTSALNACGLAPDAEAKRSTVEGMVETAMDLLYSETYKR